MQVEEFTYLGGISQKGSSTAETKNRYGKAMGASEYFITYGDQRRLRPQQKYIYTRYLSSPFLCMVLKHGH
jgi:hypothetical protein